MSQQINITRENTFDYSFESELFNQESRSLRDTEYLRFSTSGSANDGKSTLLGHLIYNSKSNKKRKFILTETPGQIGYARNIVSGAPTTDVAIILINAKTGIVEETKRQAYISSVLQIPNIILAINKIDLVDFSEEVYNGIKSEFEKTTSNLNFKKVHFLPISAKNGDNVVEASPNMLWYTGESLLSLLEQIPSKNRDSELAPRFPVQNADELLNESYGTYKGFAGMVSGGVFRVGDIVLALPYNKLSTVKAIYDGASELSEASTPQSVTLHLDGFTELKQGDMLVRINKNYPKYSSKISLQVCWMNDKPLQIGEKYIIRHTTDETMAIVTDIRYKTYFSTLENISEEKSVSINDIAHITIKSLKPLKYDDYKENRITGSLIFVDPNTFETAGAGMIVSDEEVFSYNI